MCVGRQQPTPSCNEVQRLIQVSRESIDISPDLDVLFPLFEPGPGSRTGQGRVQHSSDIDLLFSFEFSQTLTYFSCRSDLEFWSEKKILGCPRGSRKSRSMSGKSSPRSQIKGLIAASEIVRYKD